MTQLKVGVLSSVQPGIFSSLAFDNRFTQNEKQKALMKEVDVWRQTLDIQYLKENTKFEVVNILEGLPKKGKYDAYILGGSPSMVTENTFWMKELQNFIHQEINTGKPTMGFCFGHQILATAFGGTVQNAESRNIGKDQVFLNLEGQTDVLFSQMNQNFESIWSHKQYVCDLGEAKSLGENTHTPNQIIKIGENAWGCQFHPEFVPDFCSFLVKLMNENLTSEGMVLDKILADLDKMNGKNESSKIVQIFIQNILS